MNRLKCSFLARRSLNFMKLKSISQSFLFSTLVLLQSHSAFAEIITSVPEIGPHQKVLTVEKNRNPENILIVYTKTDAACNFTNDNLDQPVFDFYWLINGTDFKAMNTVLRSEVEKRMSYCGI